MKRRILVHLKKKKKMNKNKITSVSVCCCPCFLPIPIPFLPLPFPFKATSSISACVQHIIAQQQQQRNPAGAQENEDGLQSVSSSHLLLYQCYYWRRATANDRPHPRRRQTARSTADWSVMDDALGSYHQGDMRRKTAAQHADNKVDIKMSHVSPSTGSSTLHYAIVLYSYLFFSGNFKFLFSVSVRPSHKPVRFRNVLFRVAFWSHISIKVVDCLQQNCIPYH